MLGMLVGWLLANLDPMKRRPVKLAHLSRAALAIRSGQPVRRLRENNVHLEEPLHRGRQNAVRLNENQIQGATLGNFATMTKFDAKEFLRDLSQSAVTPNAWETRKGKADAHSVSAFDATNTYLHN